MLCPEHTLCSPQTNLSSQVLVEAGVVLVRPSVGHYFNPSHPYAGAPRVRPRILRLRSILVGQESVLPSH
ncbi:hypothetical protein FRC09_012491, partial [Ceratobasidium sp. 395]